MRFSPLRAEHGTGIARVILTRFVVAGARLAVLAMSAGYAVLKLLPTRDKIVLMSRLYASTSDDFAALRAEIARQSPSTSVVVLNHRNTRPLRVPVQMAVEMYHLATSRACITDSYMAAISVLRHKPSLVVVQMWHALGAIKRFGLAAVGTPEGRPGALAEVMRMHQGYDWVITGGRRMVQPFAQAFGVAPAQVLALGTPRVDGLLDPAIRGARRARVLAAYPEVGTRPVVLYAPTFRTGEPTRVQAVIDAVGSDQTASNQAGSDGAGSDGAGRDGDGRDGRQDFVLVVSLHPLDRRDFSDRPGVLQDARFTTLDWLTVADHVITDYSAVVFDAAILGVPLYFFAYDLDEYRARRGFFVDYEADMPGPISGDAAQLMSSIRAGDPAAVPRLQAFRAEFVDHVDGSCTRRIVELALTGHTAGAVHAPQSATNSR